MAQFQYRVTKSGVVTAAIIMQPHKPFDLSYVPRVVQAHEITDAQVQLGIDELKRLFPYKAPSKDK